MTTNPTNAPAAAPESTKASPAQPTYDSGLRYGGGARYANSATTTPVNDGGIVKFSASAMSDGELLSSAGAENTNMTANPNYPTPMPPVADLAATIAAFQQDVSALALAKNALRDATTNRDGSRLALETQMKIRVAYVQAASNGNTGLIVNAGFQVRNPRTPVGDLAPPVSLLLTLNGTVGIMYLEWEAVPYARSYNIQISSADTPDRDWQTARISPFPKQKFDGMTPGKTYAFRVAAIGGASGQSDWSAEVVRMAA